MKTLLNRSVAAIGLFAYFVASSALAIVDGQPDVSDHPYVGLVVVYDADGNPLWRCSGTLLSPTLFLTAAHCTAPDPDTGETPVSARVYFDFDVPAANPFIPGEEPGDPPISLGYPFVGGVTGTPMANPLFPGYIIPPNSHDVGVVILDEPVQTVYPTITEYAVLPRLGALDTLSVQRGRQTTEFDVVGYGLQYIRDNPIFGPVFLEAYPARVQATVRLVNLRNALTDGYNIQHSGDSGGGNSFGGSCFGDSGGPIFLSGSNVIVGITSFGFNDNCTGPGFAYRTDIAETQDYLEYVVEMLAD